MKKYIILVAILAPLLGGLIWYLDRKDEGVTTEEAYEVQLNKADLIEAYEVNLKNQVERNLVQRILNRTNIGGEFTITIDDKTYILIEKPVENE